MANRPSSQAVRHTAPRSTPPSCSTGERCCRRRRRRLLPAAIHARPTSRLPPARSKERKELERARKARRNKNFNLIQEVVLLWEEARRHDATPDKRSKLVTAIMGKVKGHVAELAGSHAASRVIQTCAKHGSPAGARLRGGVPRLRCMGAAGCRRRRRCATRVTCTRSSRTPSERAAILTALQPRLLELSKSSYGHFVVSKLIALAPKDQLPGGLG